MPQPRLRFASVDAACSGCETSRCCRRSALRVRDQQLPSSWRWRVALPPIQPKCCETHATAVWRTCFSKVRWKYRLACRPPLPPRHVLGISPRRCFRKIAPRDATACSSSCSVFVVRQATRWLAFGSDNDKQVDALFEGRSCEYCAVLSQTHLHLEAVPETPSVPSVTDVSESLGRLTDRPIPPHSNDGSPPMQYMKKTYFVPKCWRRLYYK